MSQDTKPFGKLFNSIELSSEEHLEAILQTMTKENASYIVVQAVRLAYQNGVYSMGEVEVLSKAIRVLSKVEQPNTNENDK